MSLNQCVCLKYFRFTTVEHASLQTVSATVSVANVHSALLHTKLLFPDKRSRFSERQTDANLHAFVAIIGDILSSHDKNQIRSNNHVRVQQHNDCESIFSNGNLSTLILIPTLPKPTAYFSVISSWRLLNQENAHMRVCDMENFYTMPMYLFLITGSEHDETISQM